MNAPDTRYFNRIEKKEFSINRKINLIATSWSSNTNKGFEIYKWIDKNLDFTRYKMTFIGNSSVNFTKVEVIPPLPGSQLALRLKESDIFITASKKDPCSNSLIEALHCGLPSIALKDGGHPDIINKGGECFQSPEEIPSLLEKVVKNYKYYQSCIDLPSLETIGDQYCNFFSSIIDSMQNKKYTPKNFSAFKQIRINTTIGLWTLSNRFPIVNYLIKH
jgi:glycosyltransferase involved in cell wall biosynthesis